MSRLDDSDFHKGDTTREIRIVCKFENLSPTDKMAFLEYLTYGENPGDEPMLYVNWTAKDTGKTIKGHPYRRVEVRSGKAGDVRSRPRSTPTCCELHISDHFDAERPCPRPRLSPRTDSPS